MTAAAMKSAFENAETYTSWPAPDMSVLNEGRRDPVPMPADLFGPAWGLIEDLAEGAGTAPDYPAMAMLATVASLIGGKRKLRPYTTADWAVPCILWCAVVGDPSSRKSPALAAVTDPLRDLEKDNAESHSDALREFHEKSEWARASRKEWQDAVGKAVKSGEDKPRMPLDADEPCEPSRRRALTMDSTPESLGPILQGNPQGVLAFRDELAGWFTSFERYSPGGREFWLEAFNGSTFVIDRKGAKEPIVLPFNGVSVLGGIQPAKLADALLASPDDGLTARFLWAWPEKRPFKGRPRSIADKALLGTMLRRLDSLCWGTDGVGEQAAITLLLTPEAADIFEGWQIENAEVDQDSSALFKSFVGKQDGAVLRLALVAEYIAWAINGGPEPSTVSTASLAAAATFVDDYAKPMAERVYGDAALPQVERHAALLSRYILKHRMTSINLRTLKQSPHKAKLAAIRQADLMRAAADYLVDASILQPAPSRDGGGAGRASLDYLVNPLFLGA
ncbi:DUF3987 domain-containing protein [Qipengyuania aquimaris]|uniref:DUF3987 domain-containing protein n=1 Tax=Qipengyuania aquimaris TaxID=255984 RepID=A0A9Q3S308_9SPHN|nr:DUF3987 domain-containing protein [Qipengyuania aquimaris]MBY6219018.1 DUF3987 domain-containing protein [Qipengyuania aquimaris]